MMRFIKNLKETYISALKSIGVGICISRKEKNAIFVKKMAFFLIYILKSTLFN